MDIRKTIKKASYSFFTLLVSALLTGCGSMYIASIYTLKIITEPGPESANDIREKIKQREITYTNLKTILSKAEQGDALAQLSVADNLVDFVQDAPLKELLMNASKMEYNKDKMTLFWVNQAIDQNYAPALCYKAQISNRYHHYLLSKQEREKLLRTAIALDHLGNSSTIPSVLATFYMTNNQYRQGVNILIDSVNQKNEPALITLANQYYGTKKELEDFFKNNPQTYPEPLRVEAMNTLPEQTLFAIHNLSFSLFQRYYKGEFYYLEQLANKHFLEHEDNMQFELKKQFTILKEQGKLSFNPRYLQCISGYNIPYVYEPRPNPYEEKNALIDNNKVEKHLINTAAKNNAHAVNLLKQTPVEDYLSSTNHANDVNVLHDAAINNIAEAQYRLAVLYDAGNAVKHNRTLANYWYLRAALRNNTSAQEEIAIRYRDGIGMPVNKMRAHVWFSVLARKNTPFAESIKNNVLSLEFKMSRKELNKAKLEYSVIERYLIGLPD